MGTHAIVAAAQEHFKTPISLDRASKRKTGSWAKGCQRCGELGHNKRTCFESPTPRELRDASRDGEAKSRPQGCSRCSEIGHNVRSCPIPALPADDGSDGCSSDAYDLGSIEPSFTSGFNLMGPMQPQRELGELCVMHDTDSNDLEGSVHCRRQTANATRAAVQNRRLEESRRSTVQQPQGSSNQVAGTTQSTQTPANFQLQRAPPDALQQERPARPPHSTPVEAAIRQAPNFNADEETTEDETRLQAMLEREFKRARVAEMRLEIARLKARAAKLEAEAAANKDFLIGRSAPQLESTTLPLQFRRKPRAFQTRMDAPSFLHEWPPRRIHEPH